MKPVLKPNAAAPFFQFQVPLISSATVRGIAITMKRGYGEIYKEGVKSA
jgi:hypothetical protein